MFEKKRKEKTLVKMMNVFLNLKKKTFLKHYFFSRALKRVNFNF